MMMMMMQEAVHAKRRSGVKSLMSRGVITKSGYVTEKSLLCLVTTGSVSGRSRVRLRPGSIYKISYDLS